MKDWKCKYEKEDYWGLRKLVPKRILRYKCNRPITPEHIDEVEFLISNYNTGIILLRRYESLISESTKNAWLDKYFVVKENRQLSSYTINAGLIPFYLINPNTKNERINKGFLNDQILLTLGSLDSQIYKYRWSANCLLELISINFDKLHSSMRTKVFRLLSDKSNLGNITRINQLIYKHLNCFNSSTICDFLLEQLKREMVSSKMAIGYLKNFGHLIGRDIEKLLICKIKLLENGETILDSIRSS